MSNSKQSSQQKRNEEFILAELNSVLSVRVEQIRERLLNERQANNCSEVENEDKSMNMGQVERPASVDHGFVPVSQARLRRQKAKAISKVGSQLVSQVSGTKLTSEGHSKQLKGGSTVDIRNYRPGYTWSRGGRIKELRIRCIARKYLLLWRKRTFGRVPLSVARHHYNTKLIHKCFYSWHTHWWEIVKEWRLGVRADCHYRFKVGLQMFLRWKKFVILKRRSKVKLMTAIKHDDHILVRKTWEEWRKYVRHKHNKSLLKKKADNFWHGCVIRNNWAVWMQKRDIIKQREEDHSVALQFWAYRVQAQYWMIWKRALEKKHHEQERCSDAGVYYNSILASKCLRAWKMYISNRKGKKAHLDFAVRVYSTNLKLHAFNHWYQRWHLLHSLHQHQIIINSLSLTFRNRWILWRWKQYLAICKEVRLKKAIADHHYNIQLLRFGWDAFRLNVLHVHIKIMRSQLAQQLREKQLQRWAWVTWSSILEKREEAKLEPKTECARQHHNAKIMGQCFLGLVDYAQWRQLRKSQYAKADAHFYLHIMPTFLFHLRLYVELEKTCRENAAKAKEFRKLKGLRKSFHFWHKVSAQSKDDRMMLRMALLHRESVIIQSTFTIWRERTKEAMNDVNKILQAREHYLVSVCIKAWDAWRYFVLQNKKNALNGVIAIRHHYLRKLRSNVLLWRKWVEKRKIKRAQLKKAETHQKSKVLRACIKEWKRKTLQGRQFKSVADVKYQERCSHLLRMTFKEWIIAAKYMAVKKGRITVAVSHFNRAIMRKVIREWHSYAVIRSYNKFQANEILNRTTKHLQLLKLSLYFKSWKKEKQAADEISQKFERAVRHYNSCMERKVMESWKVYCRVCLRKKLLARQCQWFHDVRVSAKYFLIWKDRLVEYREEKNKSQLALWHWSLVLQQKVLQGWKSYFEIRKHKKSRMKKATEIYRQQLLREACYQWLTTADSLSQIRAHAAARHQTKSAFDRFQLMQKCALHWKAWARKRSTIRRQSIKKDMTHTLTSVVRLAKNPSAFRIVSQIYPSQSHFSGHIGEVTTVKPQQSVASPLRLFQKDSTHDSNSFPNMGSKSRPPPKRPAFLVDSLKRAGLYSVGHDYIHGSCDQDPVLPPRHMISNMNELFAASEVKESTSAITLGKNVVKQLQLSTSNMNPIEATKVFTPSSCSSQMMISDTQISSLSENLPYSSQVSHTNMTLVASQALLKGEEAAAFTGVGEEDWPAVERGNSDLTTPATDVKRNIDKDSWMEYRNANMITSPRSHQIDLEQQKQHKNTSCLVQEEPFILLKPEDFMKKPAVQNKSIQNIPMMHPSSTKAGIGQKNITKCSLWTFDNNDNDESLLSVVDQKSRHTGSSSSSDIHDKNVATLRHNSKMSSHQFVGDGTLDRNYSDSYDTGIPGISTSSKEPVTFTSPLTLTPEEEIVKIRDRLKHFTHQKQKLRTLRKQYRELSDWLMEQPTPDDEDTDNFKRELQMMKIEVTELQTIVDSERPVCERLVIRAQTLAQELQKPPA